MRACLPVRERADATRAEDGHRSDGVDDLGDEHHRADLARVAARLVPLGDDDVDAGLDVALGVHGLAREGADETALLLHPVDQELRGRPEGVGHEGRAVGEGDVELRTRRRGRERRGATRRAADAAPLERVVVRRELRHLVAAQDVLDELLVLGWDQAADVVERVPALLVARVLGGDDQVDAVGPVAHLLLDPGEVDLELLGGVSHGPQHPEAAGLRHGGDDVAAVREGEDRELDVEQVGHGGAHGAPGLAV